MQAPLTFRIPLLGLLLWLSLLSSCLAEQGGFVVDYIEPENPDLRVVYETMKEQKVLEASADFLNSLFIVPRPIHLVMAEVGSENAFYTAEHHAVILSYELILHFVQLFSDMDDQSQASTLASGAFIFVMFHELGHCLIAELDLPTVGREEDAVDEFATLLLINFGDEGEVAILGAATWFASHGENNDQTPFWDEHSLDMQRFYGIFALLYGTNPQRYAGMARELGISEDRLAKAERDYEKKDAAWGRLLEPHVRR